jgi:hypothetical protein
MLSLHLRARMAEMSAAMQLAAQWLAAQWRNGISWLAVMKWRNGCNNQYETGGYSRLSADKR